MDYRRLGRTGLAVSPICLGTMGYGPPTKQEHVDAMIRTALDLGVNFIDTANCYDGPNRGEKVLGTAETMLGKALEGIRDEFVVLTKAGVPLGPGPQNRGLSASHLLRELDRSLARLRTDHVDIFMIHWPDTFSNVEEVLRAVETAVKTGRTRYFGISNHSAWQVCEYLWEADKRNWPKVGVSEIPLSILDRRYENDLPFYEKHEIGILPYQPLKGGLLSSKQIRAESSATDEGGEPIAGWNHKLPDDRFDQVAELDALAKDLGTSLVEYALAWVLAQRGVASVIVGARSNRQLEGCLKAVDLEIPREHFERVDKIAPGPEKPKPRFPR